MEKVLFVFSVVLLSNEFKANDSLLDDYKNVSPK